MKIDFFNVAQELWETEGNATQLDEELNEFYHRVHSKILNREEDAVVIYAEDGEEFQEYCYQDGSKVLAGSPIGIEWKGQLILLENVYFDSRPHPM